MIEECFLNGSEKSKDVKSKLCFLLRMRILLIVFSLHTYAKSHHTRKSRFTSFKSSFGS